MPSGVVQVGQIRVSKWAKSEERTQEFKSIQSSGQGYAWLVILPSLSHA